MEHRIIVTADDFGACNFIDNGVKEAVKTGVVTSVAAMVNFPERDSSHPWGAYRGSINAIKDLADEIKNSKEIADNVNKEVRFGLHFNFHSGCPVYPHPEKISTLLSDKEVDGKRIFKTIEEFDPDDVDIKEVIKEMHAQYSLFFHTMGYAPDHFSAHFPILFMDPDFFEAVCMLAKPMNIPIRNPFIIWQTKNDAKDSQNHKVLKDTKKFFKKKSKTKKLDIKRAVKMIDVLDDTLLAGWKRKNVAAMKKYNIKFADYVQCHLYGNGKDKESVNNIMNNLLDFHPQWYKKTDDEPVVTEVIAHVGKGEYNPAEIPLGIDEGYFSGRMSEFLSVTKSNDLINRPLNNYKTAFQNNNGA